MAWNRPTSNAVGATSSSRPSGRGKMPRLRRGLVAGAIVVLGAGLAAWLLTNGEAASSPLQKKDRGLIKEVTPAKASKAITPEARGKRITRPKSVKDAMHNFAAPPKPEIKRRELTPEEWHSLTNRTFSTATEQVMSWVFTTRPGEMPFPMPGIPDGEKANIVGILMSKNLIKGTDTEDEIVAKEAVDHAKKEMMAYLKEGGDPDDFLNYYNKELERLSLFHSDASAQYADLLREDPELAEQFRQKMNEEFEKSDIIPIERIPTADEIYEQQQKEERNKNQ